jgi:hypothetical protein
VGIHSIHWQGCYPDAPVLRRAVERLQRPTDAQSSLQAFAVLLHSGDPVAVGIACDHFQYSAALSRFGGRDVLEHLGAQVLAVARSVLRQAPTAAGAGPFVGANHASALYAMCNLAEPGDADLIADVLADAGDVNVRFHGCAAARRALEDAPEPSPRLIAVLGTLAFDASLDLGERREAVGALRDVPGEQVTRLLLRAVESDELMLRVEAAWGLTSANRLPAYRDHVQRLVLTWPVDVGYPAAEVYEALASQDDNRQ